VAGISLAGKVVVADSSYWYHDGDLLTVSTLDERPVVRAPGPLQITGVYFTPRSSLTADNTNNVVVTVRYRDGIGGGSSTIVAYTSNVAGGGMTAFQHKSLGTPANTNLAMGNIITLEVGKGGGGVTFPSGILTVTYRWL
jgi:hypothetical protein